MCKIEAGNTYRFKPDHVNSDFYVQLCKYKHKCVYLGFSTKEKNIRVRDFIIMRSNIIYVTGKVVDITNNEVITIYLESSSMQYEYYEN